MIKFCANDQNYKFIYNCFLMTAKAGALIQKCIIKILLILKDFLSLFPLYPPCNMLGIKKYQITANVNIQFYVENSIIYCYFA
jgi:hypothetical protein